MKGRYVEDVVVDSGLGGSEDGWWLRREGVWSLVVCYEFVMSLYEIG